MLARELSSEDLIKELRGIIENGNTVFLLNYKTVEEELLRRLDIYDDIKTMHNDLADKLKKLAEEIEPREW